MSEHVERISSAHLLFPLLERSIIHRFMEIEGNDRCYNKIENMITISDSDSLEKEEKLVFLDATSLNRKYTFKTSTDFQYAILRKIGEYLELEIFLSGNYKQIIQFSKF